ncbi:MAG: 30S ribosomal protein S16 [Bacteroidota bacterium]|nr:30S ribosomal protein S16 [Bacteroidota bacterium]
MPAKIRLQRFGKKGYAYYHIVVADVRAPRDGKFIERIGSYNPNTNPATIEIDKEKAMEWLRKGAQPTDTTRAILSYQGVLYKYHLQRGVSKGMVTQEAADEKYSTWEAEKQAKIGNKVTSLSDAKREDTKRRLADEAKVREAKAKAIQDRLDAETAAAQAPAETEAPAESQAPAETEAPDQTEAPAAEAGETPAEN